MCIRDSGVAYADNGTVALDGQFLQTGENTGDVQDMVLCYTGWYGFDAEGGEAVGDLTLTKLRPLLTYIDENNKAVDTMFDTVLLLALKSQYGRYYADSSQALANATDWHWFMDKTFDEGGDMDTLNEAARIASGELNDPNYKVKMVLMYPTAYNKEQPKFGSLDGERNLTFRTEDDYDYALNWWINEALSRFEAVSYTHLDVYKRQEYELRVQLMNPCDAEKLPYDPLDDTKVWSERDYPLMPVGRMILDRNPDDYRTQVEHAAFSPANLVPGIELSADKMLQGRSFVYWDAQRHRLGNGFREIPVNRSPDWSPSKMPDSGMGECLEGVVTRSAIEKTDDFTQAGERYRCLPEIHRRHLVENIAADLGPMPKRIKTCVMGYFRKADEEFAARIEEEMNRMRRR